MSKAYLGAGTVQPVVSRSDPWFFHHFGAAEYCRDLPILTDSIRSQAQPIVDRMNAGELTDEQAIAELNRIYM